MKALGGNNNYCLIAKINFAATWQEWLKPLS